MSEFDGGAVAPAESAPAPVADQVATTPNPVSTEREPTPPEPAKELEPKEPAKPISTREALQKAADKVNADDKTKPAEPAKPVKSDAARDETGKFAPKEGAEPKPAEPAKAVEATEPAKAAEPAPKATPAAGDPPARFSADAKALWATAPEPVKAEVARMEREMTAGLEKYRAAHDAHEAVRPHAEWLEKNGTNLKDGLDKYIALDHLISTNPIQALKEICQIKGFTLDHVVQHLTGQTPDQRQSEQNQELVSLRRELAEIKQQVGGVTQTFQKQQSDATLASVQEFAAKNPRFDELADDIGFFISSGRTKDLSEAYSLAERLNPAPASNTNPTPSPALAINLQAQTLKGGKSINGAPTPGSDPVTRQPSSSIRDALKRAAAQAG